KIKVLTYVNKGTAPILFGRPIMEKLGLQLDYSAKKMKWPNHEWHDVPLGPKGEYVVNLGEDNSMHRLIHEKIAFETLIPEDFMDHVDFSEKLPPSVILGEMEECFEEGCLVAKDFGMTLKELQAEVFAKGVETPPATPEDAKKGSSEGGCSPACEEEKKDDLQEDSPSRSPTASPGGDGNQADGDCVKRLRGKDLRKLIYGTSKAIKDQEILLAEANRIPAKGRERREVWEVFAGKARTSSYLAKMDDVKVETFSLPEWDLMISEHWKKFLRRLNKEKLDEVLMAPMCKLWSMLQELSLAAHPERREQLEAAHEENHDTILMMCAVTYECPRRGSRGAIIEHPWKSKAWRTIAFASLEGYWTYVDQCQYGLMLPDNNGTWGSEVVESYPPRLAKRFAELAKKEEQGNVVSKEVEDQMPEADEIKQNTELRIKVGQRGFNYVARSHKNLGHPSAEVLAKMLEEVQATGDVMKAAQGYLCPKCYAKKAPSGTAPAAGLAAKELNTRLLIDSAWVDTDNDRRCVVTVMDQATRHVAISLLKTEQAVDFIKGMSHNWLGASIKLCAGHWRLELFMDEEGGRNETNLVKAAIYVPQQINSLSIHKGYTPTQWVMGKSTQIQISLSGKVFNPGIQPLDDQGTFAQVQKRRLNAQIAFLKADTDARLRRAMNQNFRPMVEESGHPPQADPQAALKDLQALKARSTTQFRDIAQEPDNEIHANIEDQMDDYEPSILGEDVQLVAPPMSSEIGRLIGEINEDASTGQPSSSSRARSTGDAGLGGPAGEGKRRRMGSKTPATDKGTVTISEPPDAAPNTSPITSTDQVAAVPVPDEVPGELMADEILPDELSFDDVRFVSGDLPTGWTVVEGCLELDEVWLTRAETKRRSEVSERTLTVEQRQQFIEAKVEELNSYFKNAVWTFAEPGAHGTGRVSTARWVLTWKRVDEGNDSNPRFKAKARLVLRGFQDPDLAHLDKAAPTGSRNAKMIQLMACVNQNWQLLCGDVRAAFLSGEKFDRDIIVVLPPDRAALLGRSGRIHMRLNKSAYGLAEGVLKGLVTLHVDDMMIGGDHRDQDFSDALERIKKSFDFGKWAVLDVKNPMVFCGGRIQVTAQKELTLDYEEFFKKVLPINIVKNRNMSLNKGDGKYLQELNKMLRFAKANGQVALRVAKIASSLEKVCFVCFSDAALSVRSDLSSQGGFMIVACNEEALIGKAVPYTLVSWRSFKLPRVCRSSLAAEAQACAMEHVPWPWTSS
ncbi:unnamed protein product, partial [Effrenium voratum]